MARKLYLKVTKEIMVRVDDDSEMDDVISELEISHPDFVVEDMGETTYKLEDSK